jgi:hypothetical protein
VLDNLLVLLAASRAHNLLLVDSDMSGAGTRRFYYRVGTWEVDVLTWCGDKKVKVHCRTRMDKTR